MQFKELKLRKDDKCPVCSEHKVITELIDYEEFCGLKAAGKKVDIEEISILDLKNLINEKESLELIDVRPSSDFQIQHIEGSKYSICTTST